MIEELNIDSSSINNYIPFAECSHERAWESGFGGGWWYCPHCGGKTKGDPKIIVTLSEALL